MIHIDRSAQKAWSKVAVLGEQLMDRGKWVIMFPEGTRSERGASGTYKTGAARLAIATNARIVPIAVASGRCWPRRASLSYRALLRFRSESPLRRCLVRAQRT